MKQRHIWIPVIAIFLLGFLLAQDALARLAWQKYRWPEAALLLDRNDAELAVAIGGYYFGGREYNLEIAERAYKKALEIQPGILWRHYQLARIHFMRGEFESALEEINKELEANPENLRSLYVRGLIYGYRNYLGDLEKAEVDFRRFTLWAPREWAGYNDLAWILSKLGKYREAKETINAALREVPDAEKNPWLWNSLGVAELNLTESKAAKASFAKARTLAENLSLEEWQRAYPGNNPRQAQSGLAAFLSTIEENLRRAQEL